MKKQLIKSQVTSLSVRVSDMCESAHRVFDGHETVADPAACGPISADVGEGMLKVTIRRTEGNLLYCLV